MSEEIKNKGVLLGRCGEKNPKEWICKKCRADMNWEKDGKLITPNYCDYCRKPDNDTHQRK